MFKRVLSTAGRGIHLSSKLRMAEKFEVLHRPDICEFSITLKNASGNEQRAFLRYLEISDGKLNLYTTVVPSEFEGQGIAKVLANAAFEYCHQNNLEMVLSCWYLSGYASRHPNEKYDKLIVKV